MSLPLGPGLARWCVLSEKYFDIRRIGGLAQRSHGVGAPARSGPERGGSGGGRLVRALPRGPNGKVAVRYTALTANVRQSHLLEPPSTLLREARGALDGTRPVRTVHAATATACTVPTSSLTIHRIRSAPRQSGGAPAGGAGSALGRGGGSISSSSAGAGSGDDGASLGAGASAFGRAGRGGRGALTRGASPPSGAVASGAAGSGAAFGLGFASSL